jgi:hypothetical protein
VPHSFYNFLIPLNLRRGQSKKKRDGTMGSKGKNGINIFDLKKGILSDY